MSPLSEAPVWLEVNGERRTVLSCSPHQLDALAVGYLIAEGWIRGVQEIRSMQVEESRGVAVTIAEARAVAADELRRHQVAHGCGLRHVLDCERLQLPRRLPPERADFAPLFRVLFAAADAASPAGGIHAVGVADAHRLHCVATDVARHCAMDRAIGMAALNDVQLQHAGLVSTARISGAMALKAARAGLSWIASRSIATSLAHEIAAAAGVTIHERAARRAASHE